jgi:Leucine-rich repeat (LRR) protein
LRWLHGHHDDTRVCAAVQLSASHNELTEVPDVSACVLLQELRLAHNRYRLIS